MSGRNWVYYLSAAGVGELFGASGYTTKCGHAHGKTACRCGEIPVRTRAATLAHALVSGFVQSSKSSFFQVCTCYGLKKCSGVEQSKAAQVEHVTRHMVPMDLRFAAPKDLVFSPRPRRQLMIKQCNGVARCFDAQSAGMRPSLQIAASKMREWLLLFWFEPCITETAKEMQYDNDNSQRFLDHDVQADALPGAGLVS